MGWCIDNIFVGMVLFGLARLILATGPTGFGNTFLGTMLCKYVV